MSSSTPNTLPERQQIDNEYPEPHAALDQKAIGDIQSESNPNRYGFLNRLIACLIQRHDLPVKRHVIIPTAESADKN